MYVFLSVYIISITHKFHSRSKPTIVQESGLQINMQPLQVMPSASTSHASFMAPVSKLSICNSCKSSQYARSTLNPYLTIILTFLATILKHHKNLLQSACMESIASLCVTADVCTGSFMYSTYHPIVCNSRCRPWATSDIPVTGFGF